MSHTLEEVWHDRGTRKYYASYFYEANSNRMSASDGIQTEEITEREYWTLMQRLANKKMALYEMSDKHNEMQRKAEQYVSRTSPKGEVNWKAQPKRPILSLRK